MAKQSPKKKHVLAIIVVLLFAAVGSYLLLSTHAATPQPVVYITNPPWHFATTAHSKGQFTDAEYNDLASHYQIVIINKQHDNNDNTALYAATKELKRRNPNLKVYMYYMTHYWSQSTKSSWVEKDPFYDPYTNLANQFDSTRTDSWILHDNSGNPIKQSNDNNYFMDLANPDYRAWVLAQLKHRFEQAPFDGILFDNGTDIVQGFNNKNWLTLLGQPRIDAYNQGTKAMHTAAMAAFPDKTIVFNGIRANTTKNDIDLNPGRSLYKLDYMQGATDEGFCLGLHSGLNADIPADIGIMQKYSNKKLLLHSNFFPSETPSLDPIKTGRYCLGAFLMGWQPGSSYWQYAVGENAYITDAIQYNLPEEHLNLGNPVGQAQASGQLYQRGFTNGRVYVNLGGSPQTFSLPAKLIQYQDGKQLATYNSGAKVTLSGQSAAYFLSDAYVHPVSANSKNTPTSPTSVSTTKTSTGAVLPRRHQKPVFFIIGLIFLSLAGYIGFFYIKYKRTPPWLRWPIFTKKRRAARKNTAPEVDTKLATTLNHIHGPPVHTPGTVIEPIHHPNE